jgi:glyoxylase-like metal-dependent hydrolase (beta-lactamase superfamily II)
LVRQTKEGILEIVPGVHLIDYAFGCNVYVILGKRLVLIDAGLPGNSIIIDRYLKRLGRHLDEVSLVALTHFHPDHVGAVPELIKRSGCQVAIHDIEAPFVEGRISTLPLGSWGTVGAVLTMARRFLPLPGVPVAFPLLDGDNLDAPGGVQIVHTPGHTPGSISFYLPEHRVLFTGDALVRDRRGLYLSGFPVTADQGQGYRSIARLTTYEVNTACFGHGRPLIDNAGGALGAFVQSKQV